MSSFITLPNGHVVNSRYVIQCEIVNSYFDENGFFIKSTEDFKYYGVQVQIANADSKWPTVKADSPEIAKAIKKEIEQRLLSAEGGS